MKVPKAVAEVLEHSINRTPRRPGSCQQDADDDHLTSQLPDGSQAAMAGTEGPDAWRLMTIGEPQKQRAERYSRYSLQALAAPGGFCFEVLRQQAKR